MMVVMRMNVSSSQSSNKCLTRYGSLHVILVLGSVSVKSRKSRSPSSSSSCSRVVTRWRRNCSMTPPRQSGVGRRRHVAVEDVRKTSIGLAASFKHVSIHLMNHIRLSLSLSPCPPLPSLPPPSLLILLPPVLLLDIRRRILIIIGPSHYHCL